MKKRIMRILVLILIFIVGVAGFSWPDEQSEYG